MEFTQTQTIVGGQVGFAVPLIVAVTGHRDLVAEEVAGALVAIAPDLQRGLQVRHIDLRLQVQQREDQGQPLGLHGPHTNLIATIESITNPDPRRGVNEMSITGIVRAARVFGPELELRRTIMLETVLPRWAKRCGNECAVQFNETIGKVNGLTAPTS